MSTYQIQILPVNVTLLDVEPFSLIEIARRFREVYCLHYRTDQPLKRRSICTTLHGATSDKAIFILATVRI